MADQKPKVAPKPKDKPKVAPKPKAPVVKMVTVKAHIDHKCEINKVVYNLVKGEKYEVTEFAAIVLERGGIV